jgi:hypothetical protein
MNYFGYYMKVMERPLLKKWLSIEFKPARDMAGRNIRLLANLVVNNESSNNFQKRQPHFICL